MKTLLSFPFVLAAAAAQAHESLAPHHHPHGFSMLPGLETIAIVVIAVAAGLVAYLKFGRG
jgi:hypothetical protein